MQNYPDKLQHDNKSTMSLEKGSLMLYFSDQIEEEEVPILLDGLDLELAQTSEQDKARGLEIANTGYFKFSNAKQGFTLNLEAVDKDIKNADKRLSWVAPVYRIDGIEGAEGLISPLPHTLIIKLKEGISHSEENIFLTRMDQEGLAELNDKSELLKPYRYFELIDPAAGNVYELRDKLLTELDFIEKVQLENVLVASPVIGNVNDTYLGKQWNITQIKAAGAQESGWDLTQGNENIKIAILDEGCDLDHPDIRYFNEGFNPHPNALNGAATGNHGTACAGIAAAKIDNAVGIAGVAGKCQVIPINISTPWSDINTAAGINWAVQNGANVISMSFGVYADGEGSGPTGWNFDIIDGAIENAVNKHNCVLIAATGNEDNSSYNRYPARHPLVIAVGASDQIDNRKSPSSPDNENKWGSNHGLHEYEGVKTSVSVVAPGVLIPATDNQDASGYNPGGPNSSLGDSAGDYYFRFNGTSSATPQVAGLAALILSLNPTLKVHEVRFIIERSAEKVGGLPYISNPDFPSGGWNQEMGYGRIDVLAALKLAHKLV